MSLLRKLFHRNAEPSIEDSYAEFEQSFFLKPGLLFMDHLRDEGVTEMVRWLQPDSGEPEPKAFVRMANEATRLGTNIWQQNRIYMNFDGGEDRSGAPSEWSQRCLSVLAQILAIPIVAYYRESPEGELMKLEFEP